jgi:hypothetical protein
LAIEIVVLVADGHLVKEPSALAIDSHLVVKMVLDVDDHLAEETAHTANDHLKMVEIED